MYGLVVMLDITTPKVHPMIQILNKISNEVCKFEWPKLSKSWQHSKFITSKQE